MDPKKIRKMYMQALPNLNKALEHIQSQLSDVSPSDFLLETNVKPYPSAKRKIIQKNVINPLEISDLVRGRLFFSKEYTFKEVIELLKLIFGDKIKSIEHKNENEHGLEYCGTVHVDLDIDGINFELQVMPVEFKPYKEFLHQIYDKFRSDNKLSDKQKEFLKKVHNKLYKKIENQSKSNRNSN